MPPKVITTRGTLRVDDRPDFVHPGQWEGKNRRISPLAEFPIMYMLNKIRPGKPVTSRIYHWDNQPFFFLNGNIEDIYTATDLGTGYSAGPAAKGAEVVVKPTTDDKSKMDMIEVRCQISIHSKSVGAAVKGRIVGVERSGSLASFTIKLLQADTKRVLEGTGLSWTLLARSNGEVFELSKAINEHPTDYYNHVYKDDESFDISRDELYELSRLENGIEEKQMERELEALSRLMQRCEFNFLEGMRDRAGDEFSAGGLRFFLDEPEYGNGENIVDWTTDTTFSSSTDSILGGTLPFLRRVLDKKTRPWTKRGATKQLHMSSDLLSLIDECVLMAGDYRIDYGTNKYGINVGKLRGLGNEVELVESTVLSHSPGYVNSIYIIDPNHVRSHERDTGKLLVSRKNGLEYVPWSKFKEMNGETFISRTKGGWIKEGTYSFDNLNAHAIIDNVGLPKAA